MGGHRVKAGFLFKAWLCGALPSVYLLIAFVEVLACFIDSWVATGTMQGETSVKVSFKPLNLPSTSRLCGGGSLFATLLPKQVPGSMLRFAVLPEGLGVCLHEAKNIPRCVLIAQRRIGFTFPQLHMFRKVTLPALLIHSWRFLHSVHRHLSFARTWATD